MYFKYPQLSNREWLEERVKNTPLRKIAAEVGSSYSAVVFKVKSFGIEVPQRHTHDLGKDWSIKCRETYYRHNPNGRFSSDAGHYKGGKNRSSSGYIYVLSPNHPRHTRDGYVFEHILVAEKKIGRYLKKGELVHHIDGDHANNNPNNLMVMTKQEHQLLHARLRAERLKKLEKENRDLRKQLEKYRSKC
jgi:hypothetical protein